MRISAICRTIRLIALAGLFISVSTSVARGGTEPFTLMDAGEFKAALEDPAGKVVLIDARPSNRYLEGHIKGAINLFAPDLEKDPGILKAEKSSRILVYCDGVKCNKATGKTPSGLPCRSIEAILPTKSGKAAMTVANQGYRKVSVLYEGFPGWDIKGYEAYFGQGDDKRLETVTINSKELQELLVSGAENYTLVDLRAPSRFAEGHIPGAVNMPYSAFSTNAASLDKKKNIIVYSDSIELSHSAFRTLQKLEFPFTARTTFDDWKKSGLQLETD